MGKLSIKVYKDLMGANAEWAKKTRTLLDEKKVLMLNLIGSAGAGKTSLLETLSIMLRDKLRLAVLEGDVETTRDAERLQEKNVLVYQLLSGGACHLEAKLVYHALKDVPLDDTDIVFVENVGNLVCPAEFDIGEAHKIAVLSVAEGEDKPLKYPLLFREASAVLLTKTDILSYLNYNLEECLSYIKKIHNGVPVFQTSAYREEGFDEWVEWLYSHLKTI